MNREQLDEIRARASKATEGPWHLAGRSIQADVPLSDDGPSTTKWNTTVVCSVGAWNSGRPTDEDAEFIAHARTDVPALLDEIDRLQAVVRRVISITQDTDGDALGIDEEIPVGEVLRMLYEFDHLAKSVNDAWAAWPAGSTSAEGTGEAGHSKGVSS